MDENQPGSCDPVRAVVPDPHRIDLPRWTAPLFLIFSVGLLPWIVYLGVTLPRRYTVHHFDLTWVGFDVGVLVALLVLVRLAWRRSPRVELAAAAAGTMLMVDAWFDITSASHGRDLWQAVITAVVFELPISALCWWIAWNAETIRHRRVDSLLRWQSRQRPFRG